MNFNCPIHGLQYERNDCSNEFCEYNKTTQWSKLFKNSPEFIEKVNKAYDKEFNKSTMEKPLMTREEAIRITSDVYSNQTYGKYIVNSLEKLGLLKFSEEKKPFNIVYVQNTKKYYGEIKIEEWPEGLVLWVGGEIKWKSWCRYMEVEVVK